MAVTAKLWPRIADNAIDRSFLRTLNFSYVGPLMLWPMADYLDLSIALGLALMNFSYSVACVVAAVAIDIRLLASAAVFAIGWFALPVWPAEKWEILATVTFVGLAYGGWIWRK